MNYEKKYKEAQKWIESIYSELSHEQQMEAEAFFPELKESEDERIRKSIIKFLIDVNNGAYTKSELEIASWIAWLEKQGEQPSAIRWYDVSLIPQEMEELLVEWDSDDATWHEIAFYHADTSTFWNGTRQVDNVTRWCYIIDLLEKQGEQKPADKVEPKFHEGDWVIDKQGFVYQIANVVENVTNHTYGYDIVGGGYFNDNNEDVRLWTIQDAKDGDVLASELCDSIILFRGIKDNNVDFYCDYDFSKIDIPGDRFSINDGQHYGDVEDSKDFHPATKEQRDTLLKAMTDAGWEFDFEKKELKKIESTNKVEPFDKYEGLTDFERTLADICTGWIGEEIGWKEYIKDNANVLLKIAIKKFNSVQDASFEQKSAWSEEDEHRINRISDFIWKNRKGDTDEIYQQEQDVNWLKSLKNKVQPQPKHEWSEEDKKMIGRIRSIVEKYAFSQSAVDVNGDLCEKEYIDTDNWLKSLKDRVRPKQEWSEEDETKMRAALAFIKSEFPKKGNEEIMEDTIEWLKSLRPQQKHEWSEEDEKNLRRAIRTTKVVYPEAADWLKSIGNRITWKSSKGQLECLGYAIDKAEKDYSPLANNRVYLTLKSLKEQLKKLIE